MKEEIPLGIDVDVVVAVLTGAIIIGVSILLVIYESVTRKYRRRK